MSPRPRTALTLLSVVAVVLLTAGCVGPGQGRGGEDQSVKDIPPESGSSRAAAACQAAGEVLAKGQLTAAATLYERLLYVDRTCALTGLNVIPKRRAEAVRITDQGDRARAVGQDVTANGYYSDALELDAENWSAATGLQATDGDVNAGFFFLLKHSAVPFTVVLLILLIAARGASWTVGPPKDNRSGTGWRSRVDLNTGWLSNHQTSRKWIRRVSLLGVAGVAVLWQAVYQIDWFDSRGSLTLGLATVLLSVGFVVLLGKTTGHRLAVQIKMVGGDTQEGSTAFAAATLAQLGGGRPRGQKVPVFTDVSALPDDVVSLLPDNPVFKLASQVLQAVWPTTPWQVTITLDKGFAAVQMARNGRGGESIVIHNHYLTGTPPSTSATDAEDLARMELLTAAAAFTLIQLSQAHRMLKTGLCGATDWRSIAGQTVGGLQLVSADTDLRTEIYARAVDRDPANKSARRAYYLTRRKGADDETMADVRLARRLAVLLKSVASIENDTDYGFAALKLRVLYSLTAAWFNAALTDTDADRATEFFCNAATVGAQLSSQVATLSGPNVPTTVSDFAKELTISATFLATSAKHKAELHQKSLSKPHQVSIVAFSDAPDEPRYSLGDYYDAATISTGEFESARTAKRKQTAKEAALDYLELALGLSALRAAAWEDPSFSALKSLPEFQRLTGQPARRKKWQLIP